MTLTLDHIRMTFDGHEVLRDVTVHVDDGRFVSLIGRSGCGKSTLLRVAAGLIKPTAGTVHADHDMAFGFQDARLVPWIRLWDNVTLGLPGRRTERRQLALDALARVGLADHADAWPGALSGGQAQRASLARAIVRQPKLLLLDEPFGALDALTRLDMQDLLAHLQAEQQWTILMVTHDIPEAARLSDRILVLADGTIGTIVDVDRTDMDDEGLPRGHEAIERRLRAALR